jgi:hypothetical protein
VVFGTVGVVFFIYKKKNSSKGAHDRPPLHPPRLKNSFSLSLSLSRRHIHRNGADGARVARAVAPAKHRAATVFQRAAAVCIVLRAQEPKGTTPRGHSARQPVVSKALGDVARRERERAAQLDSAVNTSLCCFGKKLQQRGGLSAAKSSLNNDYTVRTVRPVNPKQKVRKGQEERNAQAKDTEKKRKRRGALLCAAGYSCILVRQGEVEGGLSFFGTYLVHVPHSAHTVPCTFHTIGDRR